MWRTTAVRLPRQFSRQQLTSTNPSVSHRFQGRTVGFRDGKGVTFGTMDISYLHQSQSQFHWLVINQPQEGTMVIDCLVGGFIWKICANQIGSFPHLGVKITNIWHQHLIAHLFVTISTVQSKTSNFDCDFDVSATSVPSDLRRLGGANFTVFARWNNRGKIQSTIFDFRCWIWKKQYIYISFKNYKNRNILCNYPIWVDHVIKYQKIWIKTARHISTEKRCWTKL